MFEVADVGTASESLAFNVTITKGVHNKSGLALKYRIALGRLSRHSLPLECFFRRYPKCPRGPERAPDIGILGAAIENNQFHAMRALDLIAVAKARRSLIERFFALGTQDRYSVDHKIPSAPIRFPCDFGRKV
jgi:hypothetical protein